MDESHNRSALRLEILEVIKKAEGVQKARHLEEKEKEISSLQEYYNQALSSATELNAELQLYLELEKRKFKVTEEAPNHLECSISLVSFYHIEPVQGSSDRQQRDDLRKRNAYGQHSSEWWQRPQHKTTHRE